MRTACSFGLALLGGLALGTIAASAQEAKAQKKAAPPANLREALIGLDANSNMVIERDEVPESGHAAFDRLLARGDANHNGKLELDELRGLLRRVRALNDPEAAAERFRGMDQDGDGKVSREEFTGIAANFDRIDTDKDGLIDKGEARTAFRVLAGGAIQQRFRQMDLNTDGKLARDEFRGPPPLFDRLDPDKDGFLTSEELRDNRPEAPSQTDPGARLGRMDRNGDGRIDRDEFEGPPRVFQRRDTDGDGVLNADEVRKARALGAPTPKATDPPSKP